MKKEELILNKLKKEQETKKNEERTMKNKLKKLK